jgi:hypothetical protein
MRGVIADNSLIEDDEGSLVLAIFSLFLLTLCLSFAIIDLSGAYLAKRELTNLGEAAISRAAHNVDSDRYYQEERTQIGTGANGPIYLLPINCTDAFASLQRELLQVTLWGGQVSATSFRCDGDQLWVTFSSRIKPLLALPLLPGSTANGLLTISANLNAGNVIGK